MGFEEPEETQPSFEPDPDIVTFLERGRRQAPKRPRRQLSPPRADRMSELTLERKRSYGGTM